MRKSLRGSSQRRIEVFEDGMRDGVAEWKSSVAAARETDRRLKARSRGLMNDILDVTYEAIRRRPETFHAS